MAISETGHHINIENLDLLAKKIKAMGTAYKPVKKEILLLNLEGKYNEGKMHSTKIDGLLSSWKIVVDDRQEVFKKVKPLVTRIIGNLYGMDVKSSLIEDAKQLQAKINSTRLTKPKDKSIENDQDADESKHSVSQQSFNSMVKNYSSFLSLLEKAPGYQTNIADLTLLSLQNFKKQLQIANTTMNTSSTDLYNARADRNLFLYTPETGLVDIALSAKNYIKGMYGASHPTYLDSKKVSFKNIRKN